MTSAQLQISEEASSIVTPRAWVLRAVPRLASAGADSPRLVAEALLQAALGVDRAGLYAMWTSPLPAHALGSLRSLLERACKREPLAYITGEKEFWGRSFRVDPSVLVPRPETELLVEWALRLFPEGRRGAALTVLDAGTGSGCLAVTLAAEWPGARVIATDRSARALAVARENALRWGVQERVHIACAHWLEALGGGRFALIVSNPPYLNRAELQEAAPELGYEPKLALDGGKDGLTAIRAVIAGAARCLAPRGWLLLEMGCLQSSAVRALARQAGAREIAVEEDLSGLPRLLRARW